jgi:predicted hydrocarbon binding protein
MRFGSKDKDDNKMHEDADLLWRDADGTLRDKVTKAHVFVFSRSAFRSMSDLLYERFQSGASVILYDMGMGYGKKLATGLIKRGIDGENVLKTIEKLAFMAGWGKFNFTIVEKSDVVCTISNSMFTLLRKEAGSKSCYFVAGLLAGNVSGSFGKSYRAEEIECSAPKGEKCSFRVFRAL